MAEPRIFSSKRDAWLSAVLGAAAAAMALSAGIVLLTAPVLFGAIYAVAMTAACGFIVWIGGSTFYAFDGERLIVRSGPFRWRLNVAEIERVTASRNPLSSPALSLDRLMLELRGGGVLLVSPRDKDGFLAELAARKGG
jgi:hypothetical protein